MPVKEKVSALPVSEIIRDIKKKKILPLYYIYGDDSYSIDLALKSIDRVVSPLLSSDFDKEVFHGESNTLSSVIDFALAFPFGEGKKFLIFKDADKVKDKKPLIRYAASPPDFTILVLLHSGNITNIDTEPFRTLSSNNFLFAAKELKGHHLTEWLIEYTASRGKQLKPEDAQILIDIVGENRGLLEAQLEKIFTFLGETKEINYDAIRALSTALKEYTIFDLQDSLGRKDKKASLKVIYNLLEKGSDMVYIIVMLTRYFTQLARLHEVKQQNMPEAALAKAAGIPFFKTREYLSALQKYPEKEIINAGRALIKADTLLKTTNAEQKTIAAVLIAEILSGR